MNLSLIQMILKIFCNGLINCNTVTAMKKTAVFLFFLFQFIFCSGQVYTDTTTVFRIETNDGNTYIGKIVEENPTTLFLETASLGVIRILQADIRSRTAHSNLTVSGDEYWLPNPQSTRYFWAPNGYGLKKGEAYYQNIWVFYNQASVGLTDNFSIGAGMLPLFLFEGGPTPFWIVPKLSIPVVKETFNLGAGAFIGTILGEDLGVFGLVYATATIGPHDKNLSVGMAYGFGGGEWLRLPVVNVSGMLRVSRRGYLISENYIVTADGETAAILSFGGRSILGPVGLDYSFWVPAGGGVDAFVAIPFLGVTVPIGRKR